MVILYFRFWSFKVVGILHFAFCILWRTKQPLKLNHNLIDEIYREALCKVPMCLLQFKQIYLYMLLCATLFSALIKIL